MSTVNTGQSPPCSPCEPDTAPLALGKTYDKKVKTVVFASQHELRRQATEGLKTPKVLAMEEHSQARTGAAMGFTASMMPSKSMYDKRVKSKYEASQHRHWCAWSGKLWVGLSTLTFIGAFISLVLLMPNKPKSGDWLDFGPRITMIVADVPNAVFLAISRITAYMMYPCMILVFTAKAHCLRTWLFETQLRLYLPILERLHDVHVRAGWFCFWLTWVHSVFHIIRWARLGHLHLIYENQTGRTGLAGWICVSLVSIPMGFEPLRRRMPFEIRKFIHTIGGVGFGISGMLHASATNVRWVYGITILVYALDWLYANFWKTYEVQVCHFTRLHSSVVLHWENPPGWAHTTEGYVNICIPFVKRYEWHAISIYPHANLENTSSLCIAKAGDWSNKLHEVTVWKTTRPVWIQGPFLTPFASSVEFDNAICVSSGSGISASLATLQALKNNRRVSLIWLSRDASMVEFYLNTFDFDSDAYTLIYYTGKQKLKATRKLPPTVLVFTIRPDLRSLICEIIASIENEDCLPESLVQESEDVEAGMSEHAWNLSDENMEAMEPMGKLHTMLGRSLESYHQEEIMKMVEGPEDDLSFKGMQSLLAKVAPRANFTQDDLQHMAAAFSSGEGKGTISRKKVISHIGQVMNEHHVTHETKDKDDFGAEFEGTHHTTEEARNMFIQHGNSMHLKQMIAMPTDAHVQKRLKRWAVLYCGGSVPVSSALVKVCADFDIKYHQEKFNW